MFGLFGQDKINLIKKSGKKYSDIDFQYVGKDAITFHNVSIVKNDILEIESNGKKIKYTVITVDPDFITGKKIAKFKKVTTVKSSKTATASSSKQNIIIHGNNNKVNVVDNSIHYNLTVQDKKDFNKLIKTANMIERNKTILNNIDEMKKNAGTPKFQSKYNNFIKSITNHMELFSSVIPFLEKFL